MKKLILLLVVLSLMCGVVLAQQPPAAGAGGGRGQGGPGGGGAPGGGRGAPVPAAPPALMDLATKIVDAVNKQDAAALTKMVAPDAVYLDEDGHAPGIAGWVTKLTTGTPAKAMVATGSHGQLYDSTGWFSFNYTLSETFSAKPVSIKGTASFVVKKAANGDWLIQLVHGALEQHIAGMTQ